MPSHKPASDTARQGHLPHRRTPTVVLCKTIGPSWLKRPILAQRAQMAQTSHLGSRGSNGSNIQLLKRCYALVPTRFPGACRKRARWHTTGKVMHRLRALAASLTASEPKPSKPSETLRAQTLRNPQSQNPQEPSPPQGPSQTMPSSLRKTIVETREMIVPRTA